MRSKTSKGHKGRKIRKPFRKTHKRRQGCKCEEVHAKTSALLDEMREILTNKPKERANENISYNSPTIVEAKPESGHVEAGKSWSQSEAGSRWKKEIDAAQDELDSALKSAGIESKASGVDARKYASYLRKQQREEADRLKQEVLSKGMSGKVKSVEKEEVAEEVAEEPKEKIVNEEVELEESPYTEAPRF